MTNDEVIFLLEGIKSALWNCRSESKEFENDIVTIGDAHSCVEEAINRIKKGEENA